MATPRRAVPAASAALVLAGAAALAAHLLAGRPDGGDRARALARMIGETARLSGRFREGPPEWACGEFLDPSARHDRTFLQCNTALLRCRLLASDGPFRFKGFVGTDRWHRFGVLLAYEDGPLKRDVVLHDTCREVVLPRRSYALGEPRAEGDLVWDNLGRTIAFDRTLATRLDVLDWLDADDVEREEAVREANAGRAGLHLPARGLLLREMERFCRFRGKRLMQAHVWDAAAFVPQDLDDPVPAAVVRTPYPWAKGRRRSFLERTDEEDPLDADDCARARVLGCRDLVPGGLPDHGLPSWAGMFQILGGSMEALDNPFRPGRNLKVSSRDLPRSSPWHRIGRRARWDGRGLDERNVNLGRWPAEEPLPLPLSIGFRCMRLGPAPGADAGDGRAQAEEGPAQAGPAGAADAPDAWDGPPFLPGLAESRTAAVLAPGRRGGAVEGPPGAWVPLLAADGRCLYHKPPRARAPGALLWVRDDRAPDCARPGPDGALERVEGVDDLSIDLDPAAGDGPAVLRLGFRKDGARRSLAFALPGLERDAARAPFAIFDPGRGDLLLGGEGDDYRDGSAVPCHRVDSECRDVLANRCHLCRHGHFEVIDHACPQGGGKFCGTGECGGRGRPACLLSLSRAHPGFRERPCQEHSPAGFCLPGLHQACDENGVLVCL